MSTATCGRGHRGVAVREESGDQVWAQVRTPLSSPELLKERASPCILDNRIYKNPVALSF